MPRKKKKQRVKASHSIEAPPSLMRRIALPTLGWAILGLGAVIFTRPSRLELLFSGEVDWWRLLLFFIVVIALSATVAAFNDWRSRRRS